MIDSGSYVAHQSMRRDMTNTMRHRPHLYSVLWGVINVFFCDVWWCHMRWRNMTCAGVTGYEFHSIDCWGPFETSRIVRNIVNVERQVTKSITGNIFIIGSWHDLDNKVKTQETKVAHACLSQTLCKSTTFKEVHANNQTSVIKSCSTQPGITVWGWHPSPHPLVRPSVNSVDISWSISTFRAEAYWQR